MVILLYGTEVPRPNWALGSGPMARSHYFKFCLKLPSQTTSFEPRPLTDARHKFPEQMRKSCPDVP